MGKTLIETILGAIVLIVAAMFVMFAYSSTNVRAVKGYEVTAKFHTVSGLGSGSDVKIAGIKVGTVIEQRLDPNTFEAVLTLSLDSSVKLPRDTVARVSSEGLLGSNFIALDPGGDDKNIAPGGQITETQSPVDIVQLLGKVIFGGVEYSRQQQPPPPPPQENQPGGAAPPAPSR